MRGAAEPLALTLDRAACAGGLTLAIETEPDGRVLLFPGAAPAAQWDDWARLAWPSDSAQSGWIEFSSLLGRTVLPGAAPAPNAGGLDRMTNRGLVALISADAAFAARQGWRLPCPGVLERLKHATRGRLLRSGQPFPERSERVTMREWEAFAAATTFDPDGLYIDYTLPESPSKI